MKRVVSLSSASNDPDTSMGKLSLLNMYLIAEVVSPEEPEKSTMVRYSISYPLLISNFTVSLSFATIKFSIVILLKESK